MKAPLPSEIPLEAPLDFLQHLWHLNHVLERMSQQMKRDLGVTAQQRLFVRCIGQYPGLTASQLATILHLDRGTVSVSLTRLTKMGLVTRHRDKSDNRRVSLRLTARGQSVAKPNPQTAEHVVQRLLARSKPADVDAVKVLLRHLAEDLAEKLEP